LGHPCKFQRLSRLGSVTARHSSSGRQPYSAALNRGRHLYLAGRPSRWALAHILVTPNTCFLVPTRVQIPNGISIGSAVFAQLTAERHCFTMGHPSLSKLPVPMGIWTHLIHGSLGPPKSSIQTDSRFSIGSAVFTGITTVTD